MEKCSGKCEAADAKGGPNLKAGHLYNIQKLHKVALELAGGITWVDKMRAMEESNEQKEINPMILFNSKI
jgi:hypothetical protein